MTRKELTLSLLQQAGSNGVTTADFLGAGAGSRFGARVQELRNAGYSITSERIRNGSYRYKLDSSEPELAPLPYGSEGPDFRSNPTGPDSLFDLAPVSGTKSAWTGKTL